MRKLIMWLSILAVVALAVLNIVYQPSSSTLTIISRISLFRLTAVSY